MVTNMYEPTTKPWFLKVFNLREKGLWPGWVTWLKQHGANFDGLFKGILGWHSNIFFARPLKGGMNQFFGGFAAKLTILRRFEGGSVQFHLLEAQEEASTEFCLDERGEGRLAELTTRGSTKQTQWARGQSIFEPVQMDFLGFLCGLAKMHVRHITPSWYHICHAQTTSDTFRHLHTRREFIPIQTSLHDSPCIVCTDTSRKSRK